MSNYAPFGPGFIGQLVSAFHEVKDMDVDLQFKEQKVSEGGVRADFYARAEGCPQLLSIELEHRDGQFFVINWSKPDHIDLECIPTPNEAALAVADIIKRHHEKA